MRDRSNGHLRQPPGQDFGHECEADAGATKLLEDRVIVNESSTALDLLHGNALIGFCLNPLNPSPIGTSEIAWVTSPQGQWPLSNR